MAQSAMNRVYAGSLIAATRFASPSCGNSLIVAGTTRFHSRLLSTI